MCSGRCQCGVTHTYVIYAIYVIYVGRHTMASTQKTDTVGHNKRTKTSRKRATPRMTVANPKWLKKPRKVKEQTLRVPKEMKWLTPEEESDEEAARTDPRDADCECVVVHEYWNGCKSKTKDGTTLRSVCECYFFRSSHTDACNAVYDALAPLVHEDRESWLKAQTASSSSSLTK
jgi:hypothetical protein